MNQLSLSLPAWIASFLNEQPKIITEQEAQMRFVLALTERNIREKTGGPFGSAFLKLLLENWFRSVLTWWFSKTVLLLMQK